MTMKKLVLFFLTVFFQQFIFAQVPQGIQYQGIARDNTGSVYQNAAITTRFIVHEGSPSGTSVYIEDHSLTTNNFGLFTAVIGNGSAVTGTFSGINWAIGSKFLEVNIGGTSIGTTQLQSVPYALYALSSGSSSTGGSIQSGNGAPTGTGNAGDFYIDITTSTLYGPYSSGWPAGVSLIGAPGTNGTPGTPGTNGTNGTPGAPGTSGTNGTNGNTILSGSTPPATSTGNTGDFYIDLATGILYGPKSGTGWPGTGLSLVGPAGTFNLAGTNGQTIYY